MGEQTEMDWAGITLVVKDLKVNASNPGDAGSALSTTELGFIDGVTAGTALASKALVLNSSKGIGTITSATITTLTSTTANVPTVNATDVDAGASGTAGTVDVFPTTASKGKVSLTAADSAADYTTTIVNASQAAARTYTIPDAGASASFVMTAGAQTVAGAKTFSSTPVLGAGTTIDLDSTPASLTSNAATLTKYAGVITSEALTTAAGASQAFTLTLTGVAAGDLAFVTKAGGTNTRVNFQLVAVTTSNTITVTLYNTEPTNAINGTVIFNLWVLRA